MRDRAWRGLWRALARGRGAAGGAAALRGRGGVRGAARVMVDGAEADGEGRVAGAGEAGFEGCRRLTKWGS